MVNFFDLIFYKKYFLSIDHSTNIRSDSVISTNQPINHPRKSQISVQYQQPSVPMMNIPDDDEPEITITRL